MSREFLIHNGKLTSDLDADGKQIKNLLGVAHLVNGKVPSDELPTIDDAVTRTSANGVKSSGIWSALWGTLWSIPGGFSSVYAWVLSRLRLKRDLTDMACTVDVAGIPQIGSGKFVVTSPSGTSTALDPFESSGVRGWGSYRIYPYIFARASDSYDIIFGLGISDIIPLNMTAKTQTVTYNGETWTVDAFTGATVNTRLANMTDIPAAAADTPAMDGAGAAGTSAAFARGDHVHPSDTSKLDKSGGTADNLLICGTNKAIKFNDDLLYIYRKINDAWVAQNIWDLRTSQDGVVAFLYDIYIAVQQIAPAWASGTAYTAKMLVTYNGVVYRCKADTVSPHTATPNVDTTHWEAKPISDLFVPLTGGTMTGRLDIEHLNSTGEVYFLAFAAGDIPLTLLLGFDGSRYFFLQNSAKVYLPVHGGTLALTASTDHEGNLAALDTNGNPTDSGISEGDLLTIVTLADSTETMASILARLNAINASHKHVFFDCSGIDVNPRLYLCTIMINADANAVRIYDQVTGKLYIGPYDAAETIGEVFAKAVDAYYSIVVTANTLDGATVTGQTVTLREGADASAPVYDTAAYNGSPVTFVVPKGFQYFVEITPGLAGHFSPSTATGVANAPVSVTLTYQDTSNITDYIGLKGFLDTVAADSSLTTDAERIAFAQAALIPAAGSAKEIPDTFTNTAGTVYDNPMVVYAIDYVKGVDGQMHLAALMQRKWCSSYDTQFDAPEGVECDSKTETAAEDGVYYYGLALGATSKTAANLTLLELSPGDALPYADYKTIYKSSLRDTTRSSLQYGDNNWGRSAYRQNLNSSAAPGAWWAPTHVGDTAPSNLNSVRGYMAGCSAALLAAAKPVYVKTWPNYITDGANSLDTVYETLDTFFLPSGVEVYANTNMDGVFPVEGPLSEYWKIRTGLDNPTTESTSTRIMYRELPVGSTANRSAAAVRLRSANRGNSNVVWLVYTSGQVNSYNASTAVASVPACAIY